MTETTAAPVAADPAAPVVAPEPKLGKPKLAKAKAKAPADPNAPPAPKKEAIPRVSPFAGKKIYLNRANEVIGADGKNPKRPGSNGFKAFSLYTDGMSVEAFLEAAKSIPVTTKTGKTKPVGDLADIRWDLAHEFIVLKDA